MIEKIRQLSINKIYWALVFMLGLSLEAVALFYQYVLDEWPCVLCIHVRIWVLGFTLVALVALFAGSNRWLLRGFHLLNSVMMLGFVERSWQTLAIERGWVFGDCSMESGLPNWFALDKWFPAIFEVQTTCGYTPVIIFNITTAEILMVISSALLLVSILLSFVSFCTPQKSA
jgi:disulfide bond formation protein DsbB